MVKIDPKIQSQVWQRVQGEKAQAVTLERLLLLEAETAAQLQILQRHFPGNRAALQKMLAQTQSHIACLQGQHLLRKGSRCQRPTVKPGHNDPTALTRRCYVNCLNLANFYDNNRDDPEYGTVYADLAQEKRRHCTQLLTILGR